MNIKWEWTNKPPANDNLVRPLPRRFRPLIQLARPFVSRLPLVLGALTVYELGRYIVTSLDGASAPGWKLNDLGPWTLHASCPGGTAQWAPANLTTFCTTIPQFANGLPLQQSSPTANTTAGSIRFFSATQPHPNPFAGGVPVVYFGPMYKRTTTGAVRIPQIDEFVVPGYRWDVNPRQWEEPLSAPGGMPRQLNWPRPKPVRARLPRGSYGPPQAAPAPRPVPNPPLPRPPGPGTKERKGRVQAAFALAYSRAVQVTEYEDLIEIMEECIGDPPKGLGLHERSAWVYRNIQKMDLECFVIGVVVNHLEDAILGRILGGAQGHARNLGVSGVTGYLRV